MSKSKEELNSCDLVVKNNGCSYNEPPCRKCPICKHWADHDNIERVDIAKQILKEQS